MKIMSGTGNLPLARAIAAYLELPLTEASVRRVADEEDRRKVAIHLQAKGEKLLEFLAVLHQPELQLLKKEFNS